MKKIILIFSVCFFWLTTNAFGAEISKADIPMSDKELLIELQNGLQQHFNSFNSNLALVAKKLSPYGVSGPEVDAILKNHFNENPSLMIVSTINSTGLLAAAYSPKYKTTIGQDVSFQVDAKKLLTTHRPVFSQLVHTVQGPIAVILYQPIFSPQKKFLGAVCDLVTPDYLIKESLGNLKKPTTAEIWILQTDGHFVYNSENPALLDRSIVNDKIYRNSPEKLELGAKILKSSKGSYQFHSSVTSNQTSTKKIANWVSVKLNDTYWRLVVIE